MSKAKRIGYNGEMLVAKYLGLHRTGATGTQIYDLHNENVFGGLLKVEVKAGKQIPKLVEHALSQVTPHTSGNQIPIVVMVPKGVGTKTVGEKAMVIISLKEFKKILDGLDIDEPESISIKMKSGETFIINSETINI